MKRFLWSVAILSVMAVVVSGMVSMWAIERTRFVPDFYQQATMGLPVDLDSAIASLENDVIRLQGDASQLGGWNAAFTDAQINAWLVQQLPKEFPNLLPHGVIDPRIVIEDGRVFAAARFRNAHIDTVISFEVKVALTEHANVLAIRVNNLRAGSLRLPLSRFLRGISQEAAKSDMEVCWDMDQSEPVALVTVPSEHPGYVHSPVVVESVCMSDGMLRLSGNTGAEAHEAFTPQGPVYQLVSTRLSRVLAGRNPNRHDDESPSQVR